MFMNYPDPDIFGLQEPHSRNKGFVMLYPGTLNRHQGLDIAVRAFARIADQVPAAEFQICGDGSEKEPLIKLTAELGLEGRVTFPETVRIREVPKMIANIDLGVVPKRADLFGDEAFSTKILEFMTVGTPVLASNTTIDQYYFDDSVICFFESGNERDLAEQMLKLIENKQLRDHLAQNALELVEEIQLEQS